MLFQTGDSRAAMRALRQAVNQAPGLAEAHALLGRILLEVDSIEHALQSLEAALSLNPETMSLYRELARAYALSGDWARSEEMLTRSLQLDGFPGYMMNRSRNILWRRDPERAENRHRRESTIPTARSSWRVECSR